MTEQELLRELLQAGDEQEKMSEKKVKILEAAIEMFSEKGYAATSTSEIARKAGVAEGTIFRHYKTKKDLLMAIVTPVLTRVVAPFLARDFAQKVFEDDYQSYENFIRALIRNRFDFVKKHLPMIKIFLQELAFHPEIKEQYRHIFVEHVYDKFRKIVSHFQQKGEIIELPPETVIRMTITTIVGYLITRFLVLPERDWDDDVEIEHTIQFLMHGLSRRKE
ncbi:MAG: TetR/AcrR family transcriptional regulator [Bacillaceae bacterium]|nr:TetR/AcrR family transcriptional regulator [Bacillaceae bacterium]